MGRGRLPAMIVGAVALAALALPSSALAGTYTWSLPSDYTAAAPGANPDHDKYGSAPWSYVDASTSSGVFSPSPTPTSFRLLSAASINSHAGWADASDPPATIALNAPGTQLDLGPSADRVVAIGWTSPLAGAATISVSGTFTPDCSGSGLSWTLDQNGTAVASGSGVISAAANVSPGSSVYLTVDYAGPPLVFGLSCKTATLGLTITAPASAPSVALASPANGGLITGAQPTFSGSASNAFGAARTVIVRVYQGSSAGGTPLQTLTATRSGTSYSVPPITPLPDGVYTAKAEQDDLASPPDAGFSGANTFQVFNGPPTITLDSLGAAPLLTSTPTFTGVAGNGSGGTVKLTVYPGSSTNGTPVGAVSGPVGSGGHFSVRMGSDLADGQYTVIASQSGSGAPGFSAPRTFRVKVHAPAVTINQPAAGSNTSDPNPVLAGTAGTSLGDSSSVTVSLYGGGSTSGNRIGSVSTAASAGTWSVRWPHALRLGLYTAQVTQTDDAGHTGASAHAFRIVPGPKAIGSSVTVSRRGIVSVPIGCVSAAGRCTGDVLVLTVKSFRTVGGGPAGSLRLMFAYVSIPAGHTVTVRRQVQASVLRTLRRTRRFTVRVIATLGDSGAPGRPLSALRRVKIGT